MMTSLWADDDVSGTRDVGTSMFDDDEDRFHISISSRDHIITSSHQVTYKILHADDDVIIVSLWQSVEIRDKSRCNVIISNSIFFLIFFSIFFISSIASFRVAVVTSSIRDCIFDSISRSFVSIQSSWSSKLDWNYKWRHHICTRVSMTSSPFG